MKWTLLYFISFIYKVIYFLNILPIGHCTNKTLNMYIYLQKIYSETVSQFPPEQRKSNGLSFDVYRHMKHQKHQTVLVLSNLYQKDI